MTAAAKPNRAAADAALRGELAHQHEQRDHRQVVTGKAGEGLGVEESLPAAIQARLHDVADGSGDKHGDGNRQCARPSAPA
jgi:hypothetical protein